MSTKAYGFLEMLHKFKMNSGLLQEMRATQRQVDLLSTDVSSEYFSSGEHIEIKLTKHLSR